MPPEVGEQIPYEGELPKAPLAEVLEKLPNTTLFYQIWQKSTVRAMVSEGKDRYTVFVPDNAALENAGWTAARIAEVSVDDIDALLSKYIFLGMMTMDNLQEKSDNYQLFSLYEYPGVYYEKSTVYSTMNYAPLRFQGYFALEDNKLFMNGATILYQKPVFSKDAVVWPINSTWNVPTQTAWEYVKSNPNYSMYVGIMEYSENRYRSIFEGANGYGYEQHNLYSSYDPNLGYELSPWSRPISGDIKVDALNTFFVPTNEAFKKAGFADLDALIAFNEARKQPFADWIIPLFQQGFYTVRGMFATDSLLDYHHRWGLHYSDYYGVLIPVRRKLYLDTDINVQVGAPHNTRFRLMSNPVVYSNKLESKFLEIMPIYQFVKYGAEATSVIDGDVAYHYAPFAAERRNGEIKMGIKGGDGAKILVVDRDVTVLDGVVQGVDGLFVPPGFLLD